MSLTRAAREDPRRWATIPVGVILLAAVLAYANSLGLPFIFDDIPAVQLGGRIAETGSWSAAFAAGPDAGETTSGRPVFTLTLALNHLLSGTHAWSYHLLNLLIHAAAGLALFSIARRTFVLAPLPAHLRAFARPMATAVATLWTVHPLQTQAVSYTVQRAESLSGLFLLLTLYTFLRAIEATRPKRWQTVSVLAAVLGMATKEVTVVAPLLVLLYDRTFITGGFRAAWQARSGYYVALAATWFVLAALVLSTEGRGGTAGFDSQVSPWHYLLTQASAIPRYLQLTLWPHPLVFDYGTTVVRDLGAVFLPAALVVALLGGTTWAIWRAPAWGFLGCWFFFALAPSSSLIPIASQTMAEHRMYLALAAPLTLAVVALYAGLGRRSSWVLVALALTSIGLTHLRNTTYRSDLSLWADTVAKRPENARAHHNLGLAEFNRAQFDPASRHFNEAIRFQPKSTESHYNLGLVLSRLDRPAEAIGHYERALALEPRHVQALNNLGNAFLALGRPGDARPHYQRAVQLDPAFAEPHSNLSDALLQLGDPTGALRHAETALRVNPGFAEAHFNAANAFAELRQFNSARIHYERALQLRPNDAGMHNNLGNVLIELGELPNAVSRYEQALALAPDFVDPRRNLALLLLHLGRPVAAEPHLDFLARRFPNDPAIAGALRETRAALGR